MKDDDEIDSENEQEELRKKKRRRFPFYGKARGGLARRRADRKAYRRGGTVSKADGEPESPIAPNAPVGGAVRQKFQKGGAIDLPRADSRDPVARVGEDIARRTEEVGRPYTEEKFLKGKDEAMPRNYYQEGGGISSVRRKPKPGESREPPPLTGPVEGLKRGGGVKKRQVGGRIAEHHVRSQYHGGPQRTNTRTVTSRFRDPHPVTGLAEGGRLTAGERQALPKSDFALPGKGKGPKGAGAGSYPIPDESHARNALARVSQHGSPAEKARVRAKVHAKYPDIGQSDED